MGDDAVLIHNVVLFEQESCSMREVLGERECCEQRYPRHVQVIDEDQQPLSHRRSVRLLGPLLHIGLQVPLQVHRGGPR